MKNVAQLYLDLTGLFEAEVLVELMLWRWNHPYAGDKEFANGLLESTAEILRDASEGQASIEGIPTSNLNFLAAVWYAEHCSLNQGDADPATAEARSAWLSTVRRALPSCFCDPSDLPPT
jgi:hypothetical protein